MAVHLEKSRSPEQNWSPAVQSQTIRSQPATSRQLCSFRLMIVQYIISAVWLNLFNWPRLCWKIRKKNANSTQTTLMALQALHVSWSPGLYIVNLRWTFSLLLSHCPLKWWSLGISTWDDLPCVQVVSSVLVTCLLSENLLTAHGRIIESQQKTIENSCRYFSYGLILNFSIFFFQLNLWQELHHIAQRDENSKDV